MTLYCAQLDSEGNPLKEEDGTYKKGDCIHYLAKWL